MYCPKCGKEITDDSMHCVHCGEKVAEEPVAQPQPQPVYVQQPQPIYVVPQQPTQPKENVLAIISLVASCLGFVTGLGFVVGIVLGVLGLKEAKKTGNGKGLSMAGLIIGIIGTAVIVLSVAIPILVYLISALLSVLVYLLAILGMMEEMAVALPIVL